MSCCRSKRARSIWLFSVSSVRYPHYSPPQSDHTVALEDNCGIRNSQQLASQSSRSYARTITTCSTARPASAAAPYGSEVGFVTAVSFQHTTDPSSRAHLNRGNDYRRCTRTHGENPIAHAGSAERAFHLNRRNANATAQRSAKRLRDDLHHRTA